MKERKIEVIVLVIDYHALLAGDEREADTKFQKERLQLPQDG